MSFYTLGKAWLEGWMCMIFRAIHPEICGQFSGPAAGLGYVAERRLNWR
jgi:hypothetical protein